VLGLGGLGSAAAYWLARGGASVIGLERFALGHDRGASQDHSRIIRLSYRRPGLRPAGPGRLRAQIGRILTELALEGSTPHDISLFRADREALRDFGAGRTWNV
jgi:hypothetical protein